MHEKHVSVHILNHTYLHMNVEIRAEMYYMSEKISNLCPHEKI